MTLPHERPTRSMGITLRTALLSWLVTVTTLAVFVVFIVPQQKRTYVESLESKAHSVAVSLRDVAAGAAINEDYSSVVDHSKEMISGDSSLVYIIITRNDGFSLIHDREGWRAEMNAGKEWRPDLRVPSGGLGTVPLFEQPVYHYSQPFDYSAIEWGWIHVGLSLDAYNRNVGTLYRATAYVSLGCFLFSLLASVIYAKRLVRPMLALRQVVDRVAKGELSSRAIIHRSDEIGALSASVNVMTDALLRRDRILGSVRRAAESFLSAEDWQTVLPDILADIGTGSEVSRISVYEVTTDANGTSLMNRRHHWDSPGLPAHSTAGSLDTVNAEASGFGEWMTRLRRGEMVLARTAQLEPQMRTFMEKAGVKSIMVIPVTVEGIWWGTLNLDECQRERTWESAEQDSIRAAVDMLGATIARQRAQNALREANNTLEQRVVERTRELVAEVEAKEEARAELANAQQQLINTSRQAGMAEIASGVLHNVGNVLNSVNVSSALMSDRLRESPLRSLSRLATLLEEHQHDVASFILEDPRGNKLPAFVIQIAARLEEERAFFLEEHQQLTRNIEHIKEIVTMQQNYAQVSGFLQQVEISDVINDAVQIVGPAFERHAIRLQRNYGAGPTAILDKNKVLQIFVNLLQNAKHALSEGNPATRMITISVEQPTPDRVRISVADNGIGIPPENLIRIFSHGFTTRSNGHGFGLHSGANFAKEMGGGLEAASAGLGQGATFTLELPLDQPHERK